EREEALADQETNLKLHRLKMEEARQWNAVSNELLEARLERHLKRDKADTERRLQFLREYAKLPPESILTIALADNPQLTQAYIAAMNARNREEQLVQQEAFRAELVKVHGQESGLVSQLMIEAVRQLGLVLAKKAQANKPQVFTNEVQF